MKNNLKQIVKNALNIRNVSPKILKNIEPLISRSVVRLQGQNLLPPRTLEFKSIDKKEEKVLNGEVDYNYYYLPQDFRKLKSFNVGDGAPYYWMRSDKFLNNNLEHNARKNFTIRENHFEEDSKYEKVLIARPFPTDNTQVRIEYYVNGAGENTWEWVTADQHEAIIMDIEKMIGVRDQGDIEATQQLEQSIEKHMQPTGNDPNSDGNHFSLKGSYFGKRF